MKVLFRLYAASGDVAETAVDTASPELEAGGAAAFSLCLDGIPVAVSVRRAARAAARSLTPFVFSFCAEGALALSRACLAAALPAGEGEDGNGVFFYDAGCCTNSFAGIRPYKGEETDRSFYARDVFMAQRKGAAETVTRLNMGFATFRVFYTHFRLENGFVSADFELEGKPVRAGRVYELEHLFLDDTVSGAAFFEQYTAYLAGTVSVPAFKYTPKGWSSWSCFYNDINEERIVAQAALTAKELAPLGADLIQLDDGWQKEGSFGAYWTTDPERFPSGMEGLQKKIAAMGLRFGIWVAPGLVQDTSSRFEELRPLIVKQPDGSILKAFGGSGKPENGKDGSVYPLDIGNPAVRRFTAEIFERGRNEYGSVYFKVDFITNLLLRMAFMTPVTYPGGYAVALYREWIREIRETVGEDVFLLACGAPVGESAGVFDSIRISPDITWGGAGKNGTPAPFEILTKDAQNVLLRSPYHNRVFVNDPDALLVRDYESEYGSDGLVLSGGEARLWATVVFLSGGQILLNEEIDRLPAERLDLAKKVLRLSASENRAHAAARAKDFFEFPYCSEAYLPEEEGVPAETLFLKMAEGEKLGERASVLCAFMNWSEKPMRKVFRAADYFAMPEGEEKNGGAKRRFRAFDLWEEKDCGTFETELALPEMAPHSCVLLRVSPVAREG